MSGARVRPPAFETLYDESFDLVFRALQRFGVPESVLEDCVQDVFIVAFKKLETFEGRSATSTWLYGIAAHVARNARRTARRWPETPTDREVLERDRATEEKSPEANAEDAQAARLLYRLLEELDDDKREVFVLAELEQLTAPEIAQSLGLNVNTVYARIRAARAAFDQAVSREHARTARRSPPCP